MLNDDSQVDFEIEDDDDDLKDRVQNCRLFQDDNDLDCFI